MIKTLLTLSVFLCLVRTHGDTQITVTQSVTTTNAPSSAESYGHQDDHQEDHQDDHHSDPYLKEGFNIEEYRDVDYPFVNPENKDYVCAYWSCREYPCRCLIKEPKCPDNHVYENGQCVGNDRCISAPKGCGAGEVFSYDTCSCECYMECASDEIRLPGVCLCGKGTFPVYNEWAVGRYFAEKARNTGSAY